MDERTCPHCAETIKVAAVKCRYCGSDVEPVPPAPAAESKPASPWGIMSLILIAGVGVFFGLMSLGTKATKPVSAETARLNIQVAAQRAVRERLKDPSSAEFGEFRYVRGKAGCGTVNARNGFGGYTGEQRFIYLGRDVGAMFERDFDRFKFDALWLESCP